MKYPLEISLKCSDIIKQNIHVNTLLHRKDLKNLLNEIFEATRNFPKKAPLISRIHSIANNISCECIQCYKNHGVYNKQFCSKKCKRLYNYERKDLKKINSIINKGELLFKSSHPDEYIVCQICNAKLRELTNHLKIHNISTEDYKNKFNVLKLRAKVLCDLFKGENNPSFNHQGKFSKWSKNFIHGYNREAHLANNERHRLRMQTEEGRKTSPFCEEYYNTKEDYLKFQSKNLDFFISKYGEIEGLKRYQNKTEVWLKSFNKLNYSKISQKLFNEILNYYHSDEIYFATYSRNDNAEKYNKEFKIKFDNGHFIFPDFIDLKTKKIIEFDGTYWHSEKNPRQNKFSEFRDSWIHDNGYKVLHIPEEDYIKNPKNVLIKCLYYLYGN